MVEADFEGDRLEDMIVAECRCWGKWCSSVVVQMLHGTVKPKV